MWLLEPVGAGILKPGWQAGRVYVTLPKSGRQGRRRTVSSSSSSIGEQEARKEGSAPVDAVEWLAVSISKPQWSVMKPTYSSAKTSLLWRSS